LHGGSIQGLYWTLVVVLVVLEVTYLKEMLLLCLLPQKMSMKHKFSLHLREEYQLYLLSWVLKGCNSQAASSISYIVRDVEYLGMKKVDLTTHFSFNLSLIILVCIDHG
jgi:hypothetical protein